MPPLPPALVRATLVLCAAAPLVAQEPEPVELVDDSSDSAFDLLWEVAGRYELRDPFDMATAVGGGENRALTRVGAGVHARWGVRTDFVFYGNAAAVDFGDVDGDLLHAYVDLHNFWSEHYEIRLGRFPMSWGDGRFLGENRWQMTPDAWDGIQLSGGEQWAWELFTMTGATGSADLHDQRLSGGRMLWTITDTTRLDTGFIQLDQDDLFRSESDLLLHLDHDGDQGTNLDLWVVLQFGEDTGFRNLGSQAAALRFEQELDFDSVFSAEVAIATGDDAPTDRDSGTYTPSMIDFHSYTGRADVVAFSNVVDFSLSWRKHLSQRWTLHTAVHNFLRQNTDDVVYLGIDATPIATPGTSSGIGKEFDLALETAWTEDFHTELGAAYFLTGNAFVHDEDFLTAYLWLTWGG